jgi:hypothetical protein
LQVFITSAAGPSAGGIHELLQVIAMTDGAAAVVEQRLVALAFGNAAGGALRPFSSHRRQRRQVIQAAALDLVSALRHDRQGGHDIAGAEYIHVRQRSDAPVLPLVPVVQVAAAGWGPDLERRGAESSLDLIHKPIVEAVDVHDRQAVPAPGEEAGGEPLGELHCQLMGPLGAHAVIATDRGHLLGSQGID